jgi:hypothetical protein
MMDVQALLAQTLVYWENQLCGRKIVRN